MDWDDDLNSFFNVYNRSSCRKYQANELNSSLWSDKCSWSIGIKFGKNPKKRSDFVEIEFFEKWADLLQAPENVSFEPNRSSWLYI